MNWYLDVLKNKYAMFSGLVLLVFLVFDSEPGENQYGPNPKVV